MLIIIGGILLFSLGFTLCWYIKLPIQERIWDIQDAIEEKKEALEQQKIESDKKYMEAQLRNKLEIEEALKKIDQDIIGELSKL